MPEKIEEGSDEGGNIGPSGSAQHIFDGFGFGPWGDKLHFREDLKGASGGIKLNWKSNEIEEHDCAPSDNHNGEVGLGVEAPEA